MHHISLRHGVSALFVALSMVSLAVRPGIAAETISITSGKNNVARFTLDGRPFVPIGVNYLVQHMGAPYQSFDMFDTKTFDIKVIDKNLSEISAEGYNVVRLWLKGFDPDNGFDRGPNQVGDAYADNVLATLQEARRLGLHVILTGAFKVGMWLPKNYLPSESLPGPDIVGGNNRLILLPQMAEATGLFYHDLLTKIASKDQSALDTIFYFDLYSELHFDLHQPPFSRTSGHYEFDGQSYDLSSGESRQALMDSAAAAWVHTVGTQVQAIDPRMPITASSVFLASTGHHTFDGGINVKPGTSPFAFPLNPKALIKGGATVMDIHFYPSPASPKSPGFHDRIDTIMRANGIFSDVSYPLPLIAGEFGETEIQSFNRKDALLELRTTRKYMCRYHFLGYVVWSWNSIDKSALPINEELRKIVSPKFNPRFCGS